jgi:hypothetical protein
MFIVDLGDHCVRWSQKKLKKYYRKHVNHSEYATMSDWMWDMLRSGIITQIV